MSVNISKIKNSLSVIILCGGAGQRLRPLTEKVPKPLIKIKNKTIIEYIINHFYNYKIKNIIIATGYKHKLLKQFINKKYKNQKIKVLDTGLKTEIIKKVSEISKYLSDNVVLCYGDTLVDIDLNKLIKFYLKDKKKFIVSSYELKSSFGILDMNHKNIVTGFREKPNLGMWFNVGYFVFSNKYLKILKNFKKF